MNKLTSYSKNGSEFTIHIRSGDLAIFHGKSKTGNSETWEVIVIQSHDGREIAGKWCDPAEYPPGNEQWGSRGWTFRDEESAGIGFARILKDIHDKEAAKQ